MKELRSKEELAAMIIDEARKSRNCSNLGSIIIYSVNRRDENWDFGIGGKVPLEQISDDCRNEINMIVGRLKLKYDLK